MSIAFFSHAVARLVLDGIFLFGVGAGHNNVTKQFHSISHFTVFSSENGFPVHIAIAGTCDFVGHIYHLNSLYKAPQSKSSHGYHHHVGTHLLWLRPGNIQRISSSSPIDGNILIDGKRRDTSGRANTPNGCTKFETFVDHSTAVSTVLISEKFGWYIGLSSLLSSPKFTSYVSSHILAGSLLLLLTKSSYIANPSVHRDIAVSNASL